MSTWTGILGILVLLLPVLVLLGVVAFVRSGIVHRWPWYVRQRRRISRRRRGTGSAEAPSPDGGVDPTSGS